MKRPEVTSQRLGSKLYIVGNAEGLLPEAGLNGGGMGREFTRFHALN